MVKKLKKGIFKAAEDCPKCEEIADYVQHWSDCMACDFSGIFNGEFYKIL